MSEDSMMLFPANAGATHDKMPEWFGEDRLIKFRALDAWWLTNGHVAVRTVSEHGTAELMAADPDPIVAGWLGEEGSPADPKFPYVRDEDEGDSVSEYLVDVGESVFQLKYVCLIRRLFPNAAWVGTAHKKPARVVVGDTVVAFAMPTARALRS